MRDNRLDILRGIAMITIAINHLSASLVGLGLKGSEVPTPTRYGWSSAAEIFVLMSGYMVGMVYLGKPDARAKLIARAVHLFKVNVLMFMILAPFALVAPPAMISSFRLEPLLATPVAAAVSFPLFLYSPRLLDILQIYVIFMFAAAMLLPMLIRKPWTALALSFSIYVAAQAIYSLNLPTSPLDNHKPTFNPFAWQLIFFAAVIAGKHKAHHKLFAVARCWPALLPIVVLLLLIAGLRHAQDQGLVSAMVGTRKPSLGPARIIHAGLLLTAYAGFIELLGKYRSHWVFDNVASIGRNSLNCFALSVVGTYVFAYVWLQSGTGWPGYITAILLMLAMVRCGAWYWDAQKLTEARSVKRVAGVSDLAGSA